MNAQETTPFETATRHNMMTVRTCVHDEKQMRVISVYEASERLCDETYTYIYVCCAKYYEVVVLVLLNF